MDLRLIGKPDWHEERPARRPAAGLFPRRAAAILLALWAAGGDALRAEKAPGQVALAQHLASLAEADAPLIAARARLADCETGCITPGEATVLAFDAGEEKAIAGRFLLDIRGGGQSLAGHLGEMLFVNSRQDYATLGTLTVAFERDALDALLRRARVCGAEEVIEGEITVKACRTGGVANLDMFTMIQRLYARRIVVDGDLRLQWVDSRDGSPRPAGTLRGEREVGYYQVWVRVSRAAQVVFVDEE